MLPREMLIPPVVKFPEHGSQPDKVLAELRHRKQSDVAWKDGRSPAFVFKANSTVDTLGRDAFVEYFAENALGAFSAFPSVRGLEQEVVAMALDLFHGPEDAAGFMSTGGSESILLAVQACRKRAREQRCEPLHCGNIVAPETLHPAFDKAASLMDLKIKRIPVNQEWRADIKAMEAAIDEDTILLVGSAPNFPYGMVDPIEELSRIALARGLWLHVDACVGGYLAPFARMLGRPVPAFDFELSGVSSISADLHKYGFAPKPASTVLYRSAELAAYQPFEYNDWPSGRFLTTTVVGTRPAGGVAAAWATLRHLGKSGYCAITQELLAGIDQYRAALCEIEELYIVGEPDLAIVAFGARNLDAYAIAKQLASRGWLPSLVKRPRAIHRMMSMLHVETQAQYLRDLKEAVLIVRKEGKGDSAKIVARYS